MHSSSEHDHLFRSACDEIERAAAGGDGAGDGPAQRRLRDVVSRGTPALPADFNTRLLQKWQDRVRELDAAGARPPRPPRTSPERTAFRMVMRRPGRHRLVFAVAAAAVIALVAVEVAVMLCAPSRHDLAARPRAGETRPAGPQPSPPAEKQDRGPSPTRARLQFDKAADASEGLVSAVRMIAATAPPASSRSNPVKVEVEAEPQWAPVQASAMAAPVPRRPWSGRDALANWHVGADTGPESGRLVTWPSNAKGTVRIDLPDLGPEDRERVRITLYVDGPGDAPRVVARDMKSGDTIDAAERWRGVRVRVAPVTLPRGGEAALWRKYPGGLHVRMTDVGQG
jgi:hypothetical protein